VTGDDLAATSITSLKAWRGKLGRAYGDADAPSAEMDVEARAQARSPRSSPSAKRRRGRRMTEFLTFVLAAPLAAMGELAVGERRGSWDRPGAAARFQPR
jgi:hypothetical protein